MTEDENKLFRQFFSRLARLKHKLEVLENRVKNLETNPTIKDCETCSYLEDQVCTYDGTVKTEVPLCEQSYY